MIGAVEEPVGPAADPEGQASAKVNAAIREDARVKAAYRVFANWKINEWHEHIHSDPVSGKIAFGCCGGAPDPVLPDDFQDESDFHDAVYGSASAKGVVAEEAMAGEVFEFFMDSQSLGTVREDYKSWLKWLVGLG